MNQLALREIEPFYVVPTVMHVQRFIDGDLLTIAVCTREDGEETYRGDITMNKEIAMELGHFAECVEQLLQFPVSQEFTERWRLMMGQGIRNARMTVYRTTRPVGGAATEAPVIADRLVVAVKNPQ
ncbi:hypothetical protein [Phyllobacterium endophyticum]|uniref:Uncharacterized protein n=1 Tax=Phyllobacterium endophyticum TaxID=1149773 RepID=A0A2P7ALP1_9HYPH|nr:hypothetical protein [Phyllobacterium endophyticum]MBB3236350.1 hypothetical protein [Phyllobacterium endophyticum]PSH55110.1 hypothetical protein CU100_23790 [Phyllobacterium endophyticum]TYR39887.1 hypothetical protein FY050_19900 [Phyllobacterium endophyticum]